MTLSCTNSLFRSWQFAHIVLDVLGGREGDAGAIGVKYFNDGWIKEGIFDPRLSESFTRIRRLLSLSSHLGGEILIEGYFSCLCVYGTFSPGSLENPLCIGVVMKPDQYCTRSLRAGKPHRWSSAMGSVDCNGTLVSIF